MRVFPDGYWYYYRQEMESFLEAPRSKLLEIFAFVVIAVATLLTVWCFAFLLTPFVYGLYGAHERSKPLDEIPFRSF